MNCPVCFNFFYGANFNITPHCCPDCLHGINIQNKIILPGNPDDETDELDLFEESSNDPAYKKTNLLPDLYQGFYPKPVKCTCGLDSVTSGGKHSSWCDKAGT